MFYFTWWYFDEPQYLWRSIIIITKKIYFGFSIGMLVSTLFDPWKKDVIYAENVSLDVRFRIMIDNLVSRFIGFVMRFFTVLIGLTSTGLSFIFLLVLFLSWLLMPAIIIALFILGLKAVNNG